MHIVNSPKRGGKNRLKTLLVSYTGFTQGKHMDAYKPENSPKRGANLRRRANPMKYQATIHTMEIQPILPKEYEDKPGKWVHDIYEKEHPCITKLRTNYRDKTVRAIINTHRMSTTPEGKYIFSYKALQKHMQDMKTICTDLGIDGYIIRRMDLCLDADAPYEQTQKLTHLIALMLGEGIGMGNRYISTDPLTGEAKTLRLDNEYRSASGSKVFATLQMEHYNREFVDQTNYAGEPIRNRFELRSMGMQAGKVRTEEDIAAEWLKRLEGLTECDMKHVCQQINNMLVEKCGEHLAKVRNQDKSMSTEINVFMRTYAAGYIYNREQLRNLLDMLGIEKIETHVNNLLNPQRFGDFFEMYSWTKVRAEIDRMKRAIMGFMGGGKMHRIR